MHDSRIDFSTFFSDRPIAVPEPDVETIEGDEYDRVFGGVSRADFVKQYLSHKSLLLRGPQTKFEALFDLERFRAAVSRGDANRPAGWQLRANFENGPGRARPIIGIDYAQIGPLLDAGATVCVTGIHLVDRHLARFVRALKEQLLFAGAVGVNCYLSQGGSGFNTHFDARAACSLQVAGAKRWWYSDKPAVEFPRSNAGCRDGKVQYGNAQDSMSANDREPWELVPAVEQADLKEVVLEQGDLLALPAGAWHAAQADGYSLALNVYFQARRFESLFADVLGMTTRRLARWRRSPPATRPSQDGRPPRQFVEYADACLGDLRALVAELSPEDERLISLWMEDVASSHRLTELREASPVAEGLSEDEPLRVRKNEPLLCFWTTDPAGERVANLQHGRTSISVSAPAMDVFERLVSRSEFTAGEARHWHLCDEVAFAWEDIQPLLELLVEQGVVERCNEEAS